MDILKQSTATNVLVYLVSSIDHLTPATGLTPTVYIGKESGSITLATPTVTEKGYGWYQLALTTAHTDTLGVMVVRATGSETDPFSTEYRVAADNLNSILNSIWNYSVRTLTIPAVAVTAASATDINCMRGDTFNASIGPMGELTGWSSIYFTVKEHYKKDTDAQSILQVKRYSGSMSGSSGLLYLNGGSSVTLASGSITVSNESTGVISVMVKPDTTGSLAVDDDLYYDVQVNYTSGSILTLATGTFAVLGDATRAIT